MSNKSNTRFGRSAAFILAFGVVLILVIGAFELTRSLAAKKKALEPIPTEEAARQKVIGEFLAAVSAGKTDEVGVFLERGLDVNSTDGHTTALFAATQQQDLNMIQFLLSKHADPNNKAKNGDIAVNRACWLGNKQIADTLIAAGSSYNPYYYYAGTGDLASLQKQLDTEVDAHTRKRDMLAAIDFATAAGQFAVMDWLWQQVRPLLRDETGVKLGEMLKIAAKWNRLPAIEYVAKQGYDIKTNGQDSLTTAAGMNHPAIVKYLFEQGIILPPGKNADILYTCIDNGWTETAQLLLDHGVDPTLEVPGKGAPLDYAKKVRPDMAPLIDAAVQKWNAAHPRA